MSWGRFIKAHLDAIAGMDFFTEEVVTRLELLPLVGRLPLEPTAKKAYATVLRSLYRKLK